MTNDKAQMPNQAQKPPLKVRGVRPARLPLLTCPPLAFADLPAAQLWQAGALAQAGTAMAGGSFSASRPNTCPPGLGSPAEVLRRAGRREFFGRRGSYENHENNPLYPLIPLTLRGKFEGRGSFGI